MDYSWWQIAALWCAFSAFNIGAWSTIYNGPAQRENSLMAAVVVFGPFATLIFFGGLLGLLAKKLQ